MRTHVGQPVRLADYRVPDFLIDSVDLDISLDRSATRVVSTLAIRPHPDGRAGAALELDGDELDLIALQLDGATLDLTSYVATPSDLSLRKTWPRTSLQCTCTTRCGCARISATGSTPANAACPVSTVIPTEGPVDSTNRSMSSLDSTTVPRWW